MREADNAGTLRVVERALATALGTSAHDFDAAPTLRVGDRRLHRRGDAVVYQRLHPDDGSARTGAVVYDLIWREGGGDPQVDSSGKPTAFDARLMARVVLALAARLG